MNKDLYQKAQGQSFFDRASVKARKKMYDKLAATVPLDGLESVLDVGVTADRKNDASNFFEKLFPYPEKVTALSNQDASWMEDMYSGLQFVQADALDMPFENDTYDLVFSGAVIEHVGNKENQRKFIAECVRVAKRYVFITTPNRYYPIELHTVFPLIHWLPRDMHRSLLRKMGEDFFADENNLNLLSKKDLSQMVKSIGCQKFSIDYIRFFGMRSNLLLTIEKEQ